MSNSAKLRITAFDGFSSNVNLSVRSVSPALSGAVFNFSDTTLTLSEYTVGSDFWVEVPTSVSSGLYIITIEGRNGGLTRTIDVRLNVNTKDPTFIEI